MQNINLHTYASTNTLLIMLLNERHLYSGSPVKSAIIRYAYFKYRQIKREYIVDTTRLEILNTYKLSNTICLTLTVK